MAKIIYTEEKRFTISEVKELFLSVGWESASFPNRLYHALMHSSTVITAWDGRKLVGLARVLDDGGVLAYLHYVLVRPDYQGCGIASHMVAMVKEDYKDYLYLELMPERTNAIFYEKLGFRKVREALPMHIVNFDQKE